MSCDDLWLDICQKRGECDEKIKKMKGVAFFFSSVAALEKRSKEKGEKTNSQGQEDDPNEELPEILASSNLLDCSTVSQWHARINGALAFGPIRNGHGSHSQSPTSLQKRK